MSQVDHMEVAPRMWDKSLAASYIPKNQQEEKSEDSSEERPAQVVVPAATVALGFMDKLKMYLVPALLILGIIVSIYILWKYFMIYRNNKTAAPEELATPSEPPSNIINPQQLIKTEDMSKYEVESEDESEANSQLSRIEELSDEEASDDEASEEDASEDDASEVEDSGDEDYDEGETPSDQDVSEVDEEEKMYAPDISEIEQLIKDSQYADGANDIAILEDDDMFGIPTAAPAKKPKRASKKPTRITL